MPSDSVTLFTPESPDYYILSEIYKPGDVNSTGTIIPKEDSLVWDSDNEILYFVESVDSTTHASTLKKVKIVLTNSDDDGVVSIVSYKNDIVRLFYDTRTSNPMSIRVDGRFYTIGEEHVEYQIFKNFGTINEEIVSRYYNAAGVYQGTRAPMVTANSVITGMKYCNPCHTNATLADGDKFTVVVYDETGAETAEVTVFARKALILNEAQAASATITGLTLSSNQDRANDEMYIFENQTVNSLNIVATLNFSDGTSRDVDIDSLRCFIYGLANFIPAYQGQKQEVVVKYHLANDEAISQELQATTNDFLYVSKYLVVVPNELAAGVKISVIPRWSNNLSKYVLYFYLYSTDRDIAIDVTSYVTLDTAFNGTLYGTYQTLVASIDMSKVLPSVYTEAMIYQQSFQIRLKQTSFIDRYVLRDSESAYYVYGTDSSTSRRPVLHYDSTRLQYFVPSPIFTTQEAFLRSFYTLASVPFNSATETLPPTPTHFVLRDMQSGSVVVSAPIPVTEYASAFSIIADSANQYVDNNVIVEFLYYVNDTTYQILYGVPVDVYLSEGGYQGT